MHQTAYDWVACKAKELPARRSVLEFGSRNVNGTTRPLFASAERYHGVDVREGPCVDQVADAATFTTDERFDTVVCTEVLEHTDKAQEICHNAYKHLLSGGVFIMTAAGEGRAPHSAVDGGTLRDGEYYGNVNTTDLRSWMGDFSLVMVNTETPGDIYAIGIK